MSEPSPADSYPPPAEAAPGEEVFVLCVPVDTRYLAAIRGFCKVALGKHCAGELDMLILALDESCSNAIRHRSAGAAEPGLLRIVARVRPGYLRFDIGDYCCPGDVANIKPRNLDDVRPGGLGTFLIGEIMDRVEFEVDEQHPGRMILVMEKSWAVEAGKG